METLAEIALGLDGQRGSHFRQAFSQTLDLLARDTRMFAIDAPSRAPTDRHVVGNYLNKIRLEGQSILELRYELWVMLGQGFQGYLPRRSRGARYVPESSLSGRLTYPKIPVDSPPLSCRGVSGGEASQGRLFRNEEALPMATFQGTIEELGMSIFMQGTHKLVDDKEELVALLQSGSDSLDLNSYLGQKVKVTGSAAPSVEGGSTFVTVDSVSKI